MIYQGGIKLNILCISCSNVAGYSETGTSANVCRIIKKLVEKQAGASCTVNIEKLHDYNPAACNMCMACAGKNECVYDSHFNKLFQKICQADLVFYVIPHYSIIPAKLTIIFEKMQEICYVNGCRDRNYIFPLIGKRAALIGHGGSPKEMEPYYRTYILNTVASVLKSVGVKIATYGEQNDNGVVFGVTGYIKKEGKDVPDMQIDWIQVEEMISGYVSETLYDII